jgi:hypothetical protein
MLNGSTWTREQKLRVRTLYLVKGWTASEIAEEFVKEPRQVTALVNHQGWAKRRREIEEKAATLAERKAIQDAAEFVESVALRGEEATHQGFDLAGTAAGAGDALAFSAAMSGTKNAVALTRQALGIDSTHAPAGLSLHVVFARPEPEEPRRVEPLPPEQIEAGAELEFA